jgi:glycerol kinase
MESRREIFQAATPPGKLAWIQEPELVYSPWLCGIVFERNVPKEVRAMEKFVISVDQGTTSTRAIIFNEAGSDLASGQLEHKQIMTQPGWVEHDAMEVWDNARAVVGQALGSLNITRHSIAAVGITNQRETSVVWNKHTGIPVYNALVWQDTRTQPIVDRLAANGGINRFREVTGLPLATFFSGTKIMWILENVPGAKEAALAGDLLFGTMDTWLLWNFTGGIDGGVHKTDVTNASRTMLMNLRTLAWDEEVAAEFGVPMSMLPEICSSSEVYGIVSESSLLRDVPISGILGDQQAATFGQAAFSKGESKNTYGTGNFLIFNTGEDVVLSKNGLLTTLAYKLGDAKPVYALEGSIAVTGSLIQWLRDNLNFFQNAPEVEAMANTVADNGGCYFVPAFSGLFAPHWRPDARGALVGLTRFINKGHIARAALEATGFQTLEVLDALNADSGVALTELKVDGGMTKNNTLMQFQADILGVPVIAPVITETTALGAAYAAGLAVGFWEDLDQLRSRWREGKRWIPNMEDSERQRQIKLWKKAVTKTLDWVE